MMIDDDINICDLNLNMVCLLFSPIRRYQLITDVSENINHENGFLELDLLISSNLDRPSEELKISRYSPYEITKPKVQNSRVLSRIKCIKTKCITPSKLEGANERSVDHKVQSHISISGVRKDFMIYMLPRIKLNHSESTNETLWQLYRKEINRLRTFYTYPSSAPVSGIVLANQGFVYIGTGNIHDDTVACYACRRKKKNWKTTDDVHEIHKLLFPKCSMVTGINSNNEPLVNSLTLNYQTSVFDILKTGEEVSTKIKSTTHGDNAGPSLQCDSTLHTDSSIEVESNVVTSLGYFNEESGAATVAIINKTRYISESNSSSSSLFENNQSDEINYSANQLEETYAGHTNQDLLNNTVPTTLSSPLTSHSTNSELIISEQVTSNSTSDNSSTSRSPPQQNQINPMTYEDLGIITQRPKRPEYAIKIKRLESFSNKWPRDHHLNPLDLIEAGFYYAGYGDCTRCFHCGGGLRNWEDEDHEWVEHARWFPRCAYLRHMMGQAFVDEVQKLHGEYEKISFEMVMNKMGACFSMLIQAEQKDQSLVKDAAVKSLLDLGYEEKDILEVATIIKSESNAISADSLLSKLIFEGNIKRCDNQLTDRTIVENIEYKTRALKEKNNQLRQQTVCKICMDKEVDIVFLPCGHLVSCAECASVMTNCPYRREVVKGLVRAIMA